MLIEDRIRWEIHYADLSVYTQESGLWGDAPTSGVLIVIACAENNKQVYMGMDYYYMDPTPSGSIGDFLEADVNDYTHLPRSAVKIGNWVNKKIWDKIHYDIFGV